MKIVVNKCFGGFSLSEEAVKWLTSKGHVGGHVINRDDPLLVEAVETLGHKADGPYSSLGIIEIPDGVDWQIDDYDGNEWVAEKHRTWEE